MLSLRKEGEGCRLCSMPIAKHLTVPQPTKVVPFLPPQVKGTLKWAGPGMPDVTSGASSGGEGTWVDSKHLKEPAHYGTVTSVAAAVGRVWTAGGSSAFVCLREWSQRGEFLASTDLRSVGELLAQWGPS